MFPRWFTTSQWSLMAERHYTTLHAAYPHAFQVPYAVLKAAVDALRAEAAAHTCASRAHFDNAAEAMRDVWEYPRVVGDERYGHATPKPVDMMSRIMRASLPAGGLCLEPFGGTGSTLIAAERTGRRCYTMEITPEYVEVILARWEKETRRTATQLA
jgi:hypothetical protein